MLAVLRLAQTEWSLMRRAMRWIFAAIAMAHLIGCQTRCPAVRSPDRAPTSMSDSGAQVLRSMTFPDADVRAVSYTETAAVPPPRVRDIGTLEPWPMSLDDAVRIALENSLVIRSAGGRVLAFPDSVRTTLDPAVLATDPNLSPTAALSAFDTQLETGLFWNGGGRSVGSALSNGAFGVFAQPTTLAKVGLERTLPSGTRVSLGGIGGYDEDMAGGMYAAYGGELRLPLLRGAGTEFNRIAGPYASPGNYCGVWIARIDANKAHLELEQAVRDLVRDVALTYWELYFAYQNLDTKRAALEHARQSWQRERIRVAEQASPPDFEALARQQYYTAASAV